MINPVDSLDKIFTEIQDRYLILRRIKFYSLLRFLLKLYANIYVPFYYSLTSENINYRLDKIKRDVPVIVSLTSFPLRINRLWIVIESIFRQIDKPDRIILWLSKEQFANIEILPRSLKNLINKGLEIYLVDDDLKSHKKYYYTLKNNCNSILVTIDDDILYPTNLLRDLLVIHKVNKNAVICHRAFSIEYINNNIASCLKWQFIKNSSCKNKNLFFTTGGGTLFPPNSLYSDTLDSDLFKRLSFLADDVWLNAMAKLNKTEIIKTNFYSECIPIMYLKNIRLTNYNDHQNGNDLQINQIRSYYIHNINIDPFK